MPRMNILTKSEQEIFDLPPVFNSAERRRFFNFPKSLKEKAESFRKPSTKVGFLLACGYFKAAKKFFKPEDYPPHDVAYIAHMLNLSPDQFIPKDYVKSTRIWHQNIILEFYGYKRFDQQNLETIKVEIVSMVRSHLKPKLIFWRCMDVCICDRIQTPSYFQLAELITTALHQRKKELIVMIHQHLTDNIKLLLNGLLSQQIDSPYGRYKLTLLKKLSQSTQPVHIKERATDLLYLAELYQLLKPLLPALDLGYEGIQYFAQYVLKADIFQLSQRKEEDLYVHVVAFIVNQYYRLQDNLIDSLLAAVRSFENGAKRDHKDWYFDQRKTQHQTLKMLVSSVDESLFGLVRHIKEIIDKYEEDSKKISSIKNLLTKQHVHLPTIEQQWKDLKRFCRIC